MTLLGRLIIPIVKKIIITTILYINKQWNIFQMFQSDR